MAIGALIAGIAAEAGVTVEASSNVTPAVTLFDARSQAPSLLDALGIRPHVVVKTADGRTIAEYGEPAAFDPVLTAFLLTIAAASLIMLSGVALRIIRGARP